MGSRTRKETCIKHHIETDASNITLLRQLHFFVSIVLLVPLWCLWFVGGKWLECSLGDAATGMPCPCLWMMGDFVGEAAGPVSHNS
jgi:hypothetical protein